MHGEKTCMATGVQIMEGRGWQDSLLIGAFRTPSGVRNIIFMSYKRSFVPKVIELFVLGKI